MRLPAIDPEARALLDELDSRDNIEIISDLADIEMFAADPWFRPEEVGVEVPGQSELIYVTRMGVTGRWWVFWRLMPTDPRPLRRVHVLRIEEAPPVPLF